MPERDTLGRPYPHPFPALALTQNARGFALNFAKGFAHPSPPKHPPLRPRHADIVARSVLQRQIREEAHKSPGSSLGLSGQEIPGVQVSRMWSRTGGRLQDPGRCSSFIPWDPYPVRGMAGGRPEWDLL